MIKKFLISGLAAMVFVGSVMVSSAAGNQEVSVSSQQHVHVFNGHYKENAGYTKLINTHSYKWGEDIHGNLILKDCEERDVYSFYYFICGCGYIYREGGAHAHRDYKYHTACGIKPEYYDIKSADCP